MHFVSDPLLAARARLTLEMIDSSETQPGALQIWSGGVPDRIGLVETMTSYSTDTDYEAGAYCIQGAHYYKALSAGTSGAAAPSFSTDGSTFVDNNLTWQDMGEIPYQLATVTFTKPAGTLTGATLTLNAASSVMVRSGTATWAQIVDGDGHGVYLGDCGGPYSGSLVELNTLDLSTAAPLRVNALNISG